MTLPPGSRLSRPALILVGLVLLVGLGARAALLVESPRHAFLADHLDSVVWSEWAYRHGPLSLYDLPPFMPINTQLPDYLTRPTVITPLPSHNACNYPPLAGYIYWTQGFIWHLTNPPVVSRPVSSEVARIINVPPGAQLESPVANSIRSRAAGAVLPTLADLLLAVGTAYLVYVTRRVSRDDRDDSARVGTLELVTFAVAWLAPPIMLTSAFWGQIDSLVTVFMIWCLALLVRGRPALAGVMVGLALLVKPQGILILPAAGFALLATAIRARSYTRLAADVGKFAGGALLVLVIIATPQMLADLGQPDQGSWRWFIRAYPETMTQKFPITTMKAFNVWWLDFLTNGQRPETLLPDHPTVLGLTKAGIGQALLLIAGGLAVGICAWRYRTRAVGWVACAALTMLAVFLFPTRIHERYIFYCLPFVIAAALLHRLWLPALVALLVVASAEVTWNLWLAPATQGPDTPAGSAAAAAASVTCALLALASFIYALLTLLLTRRPNHPRE